MDWDDLKFFIAVAKTRNVTEAGILTKVSAPTVARKIAALEEALGATLFEKMTTGYFLTEAGEYLLPLALEAEARIHLMERQVSSPIGFLSGRVRIDCPELLGTHLILPEVADFQEKYPEICFDFVNSVVSEKLAYSQSDILVRLHQPDHGNFTVRRVGELAQALYCSPEYAEKFQLPKTAEQLLEHRLIGWTEDMAYLPLAQWFSEVNNELRPQIRVRNLHAQLMATTQGLGICVLPAFAARSLGLVQVLPNLPSLMSEIWILRNQNTRDVSRVDVVCRFLMDILNRKKALLS